MTIEETRMSNQGSEGGPQGASKGRERGVDEISLLELASVLLKRWKFVAGLPLAAALMAAAISFVIPRKYEATATFVPEAEPDELNLPSGLVGLAAQFGVAVPMSGGASSPEFYAEVLGSRTLSDEVLSAQYADPRTEAPDDSATLLDLLKVKGDTERERLEKGREKLRDAISVRVGKETSIVSVSVETRYRALSADVANLCISLLNRFNLETRQSNAQERRRFIEGRVREAEGELQDAEGELKEFLERNRQFAGSPELQFQYDRLQRRVLLKQDVLSELSRQYEEARIQEVNDTPLITVIDRAVPPEEKSSPKRVLNIVLALGLGGVLGVIGAFGREIVERSRTSDREGYEEFASRWATVRTELRSMFSRLRRSSQ